MFSRTFKRLIAQFSVAAVLFAQLAVAAYACPAIGGAASVIAAANADAVHAAMPGCEMRNRAGNPNLCLQHCQAGDQSVQTLQQVEIPTFAAISTLVIFDPVPIEAGAPRSVLLSAWSDHAQSPPPLTRFGVLRI